MDGGGGGGVLDSYSARLHYHPGETKKCFFFTIFNIDNNQS